MRSNSIARAFCSFPCCPILESRKPCCAAPASTQCKALRPAQTLPPPIAPDDVHLLRSMANRHLFDRRLGRGARISGGPGGAPHPALGGLARCDAARLALVSGPARPRP